MFTLFGTNYITKLSIFNHHIVKIIKVFEKVPHHDVLKLRFKQTRFVLKNKLQIQKLYKNIYLKNLSLRYTISRIDYNLIVRVPLPNSQE
jgi:hypothetical protein